jgi:hypothetical protein
MACISHCRITSTAGVTYSLLDLARTLVMWFQDIGRYDDFTTAVVEWMVNTTAADPTDPSHRTRHSRCPGVARPVGKWTISGHPGRSTERCRRAYLRRENHTTSATRAAGGRSHQRARVAVQFQRRIGAKRY